MTPRFHGSPKQKNMEKEKFPRAAAEAVAAELMVTKYRLGELCERWAIAGSIRRKKPEVSDIEIVYVPSEGVRKITDDFFPYSKPVNCMAEGLNVLVEARILKARENKDGHKIAAAGDKNKFVVHLPSGIPVDFFSCPAANWWNYFTCRTGSAASNERISNAALARGYHWRTGGPGFEAMRNGEIIPVHSEEEVFAFVGLPYLPPEKRV